MKSYTNLQQSQILAEILSHDTADQIYEHFTITKVKDAPKEMLYKHNGDVPFQICGGIGLPCWSLAALLNLLPNFINRYTKSLYGFADVWYCGYEDEGGEYLFNIKADNLLDACYEMILKLHELKLI